MAAGRLWVIATPIGNLDDLSPRAAELLRTADLVAAEDTRHSAPLLARVGSAARMIALHEHNEREQSARIVEAVLAGGNVALIADAGTPLISDPGYRVVRAVREAGGIVSPVPGPCAAIAALSVAGLPSDRFVFEGFLPAKSSARRERMRALASETRTLIFYESSHRIAESLADAIGEFGATREAVRKEKETARPRAGRPKHYTFSYKAPTKAFRLQLRFTKSKVDRDEVIDALQAIIKELRAQ